MILSASYVNGFAPRDGQPLYPELWRGCVGAWNPGLGPTGLTLHDWSGRGNHGTLTNMDPATDWATSGGRYALDFDGTNDYVGLPLRTNLNADCTVSAWILTRITAYQYCIATEGLFSPPSSWFLIRIDIDASRRVCGYVFDGSSREIGNTTLALSTWTHVAFRRFGNIFTLFVNGKETGSASYTPSLIGASPSINDIGARRNLPTEAPFDGQVTDLMAHSFPLPESSIRLLSLRRGIAYDLAPRLRSSSAVQFNRRRRLLVGAGS